MKSHTAHLTSLDQLPIVVKDWQIRIPAMVISVRQVAAALVAVMSALILVTLSVWIAELEVTRFAASAGWGAAFIFMASAVDNRTGIAILQVITAFMLAVLAWAQFSWAAEWGVVSAVILAPWLAMVVYKVLRRQA